MARPIAVHVPILGFKTRGDWTAKELMMLVRSVSRTYNALDVFHSLSMIKMNPAAYHDYLLATVKLHPPEDEERKDFYAILSMIADYVRKHVGSKQSPDPHLLLPFTLDFPFVTESSGMRLFEAFETIAPMRIYRIRMSSPGGISFSGLGEIIKEIRELVKDVWYRNRQESTKGNLEIISQYLDLKSQYSEMFSDRGSASQHPELVGVIAEACSNLQELENQKFLDSVPENLGFVDEDQDVK